MTKVFLLDALTPFTEEAVKDIIMPVRMQKEDKEPPQPRPAKIYQMRLTKSKSYDKAAPYIIHQVLTGRDGRDEDGRIAAQAVIRTIFCVYSENEQEGALMLLNLMERVRIELLKTVALADQYQLDLNDGLETIIYPDDTAPYYSGEMASTWNMPSIKREVGKYVS